MHSAVIACPCCGETFETRLDGVPGRQQYTEDCPICCQPIAFTLELEHDGSLRHLEVRREND